MKPLRRVIQSNDLPLYAPFPFTHEHHHHHVHTTRSYLSSPEYIVNITHTHTHTHTNNGDTSIESNLFTSLLPHALRLSWVRDVFHTFVRILPNTYTYIYIYLYTVTIADAGRYQESK